MTLLASELAETASVIRRMGASAPAVSERNAADAKALDNGELAPRSLEQQLGLTAATDAAPDPRPHVLVVDDEPVNLQAMVDVLRTEFRLSVATDGDAALARAAERPDVILLDIMMPGMNGYEVCRRLKDNDGTRDIPGIFGTSIDSAQAETRGLDLGAVDYIVKPINAGVTMARVRTQVNLHRSQLHLAQLSELDPLTGIANRRRFDDALATE